MCLEHGLELVEQCSCKEPLKLFPRGKPPFCCVACGLGWEGLPHKKASQADTAHERTIQYFFEILFAQGTPNRLARLLSLIEEHELGKEAQAGKRQPSSHYISRLLVRGTLSLKDVVQALARVQIPFHQIFADWTNTQDKIAVIE